MRPIRESHLRAAIDIRSLSIQGAPNQMRAGLFAGISGHSAAIAQGLFVSALVRFALLTLKILLIRLQEPRPSNSFQDESRSLRKKGIYPCMWETLRPQWRVGQPDARRRVCLTNLKAG